ncbi:hypothetical protein Taro_015678 [Colocasia esculenta]|uniref:Pectinesterase n=1 Tax=Colocasia esculenta TaxID=4460 RepID=A0A843UII2_COLES|nr:hypothetical protein [Colocasia esculenta]
MDLMGSPVILLSAVFVALLSIHAVVFSPWCLQWLSSDQETDILTYQFSPFALPELDFPRLLSAFGGRHHHSGSSSVSNQTICDDFPLGIPPPDTNTTTTLCVDRRGCCNFTSVQSAVDSINATSQKRTVIWINKGIYFEKVRIPSTKPNITLQGQGLYSTAIVWNDTANSSGGTYFSASVSVFAANFIAKNISFMNVAPMPKPGDIGAQAVAVRIGGDQAAFWGCGFFGAQDTLLDDRGRHYFKECFIQGSIDFIFGNGRSLYENCELNSIATPVPAGQRLVDGAIAASGRAAAEENSGFSFVNCTVGGTGRIWLGRAWKLYARVVYAFTFMSNIVAPEGWNDLNDPSRDQLIFFGEYMCSGPGSIMTERVPYAQRLNDTQAVPFFNISYIDGDQWLQPFA